MHNHAIWGQTKLLLKCCFHGSIARRNFFHHMIQLVEGWNNLQLLANELWAMIQGWLMIAYWHLTLFGTLLSDWSTNQGVVIMWSNTATGHGIHKQKDGRKWGDECQKTQNKSHSLGYGRNYVHCLQQALWNRAASLGREVPEQSEPHLSVQNKIQL